MGRAWKALTLAIAMLSMSLAGCIGVGDDALENQSTDEVDELINDIVQFREDNGFEIDTPADIVLVGFEPWVGEELEATLEKEKVLHSAFSFTRDFPPGSAQPVEDDMIVPVTPNVTYEVQQLDQDRVDEFFSFVAEHPIEDKEGVYDANAAEDELARMLPEAGIQLNDDTPTFVILHAEDRLEEDHAWRFTYPNGHLEPVRAFGERSPLLVYDVSAQEDPYVVGSDGTNEVPDYNYKMRPGGIETVPALEELVIDATHYRLAKGSVYPVSTQPCHKVTFVLAVHQTALTDVAPQYQDAEDWVDVNAQEAVFENATGDEVTVEMETLMLPQDDPALDATTRRAAGAQESGVFLDMMRWYLDENWEDYVDPSEDCQDYLSLLLFADATSEPGRAFSGIGMYDVNTDRRITFSVVTDAYRLPNEYDGPGDEMLGYDEWREPDYVNRLFSHETGHVLGLHHPQHLSRADGPSPANSAFESVWSSMSYQAGDRLIDFGEIDNAQFERNRAGYIIQHAQKLGLEDTPAYDQALERLTEYDWEGVYDALHEPVLEETSNAATSGGEEPFPRTGGHHWHR